MPKLLHEQARFFRTSGYYRLPNVLSYEQTAELRAFVTQVLYKLF